MSTYTIKQLSEQFDIPASTLRYYESIGLLPPVERNQQQRVYDDIHIQRLHAIECFKNTGLSIGKMLEFFEYEQNLEMHIEDILALVSDHEEAIQSQIAQLQQDLLHIQHKVRYYTGIKHAIEAKTTWPTWEEA